MTLTRVSESGGDMTRYLPAKRAVDARVRVFCFPYAGGGASAFAAWQRRLGDLVQVLPVQLPGREGRASERRFTDLDFQVRELAEHLGPDLEHPHILLGHSMGSLIAYSLARHRAELGRRLPLALVVSGYRAPHLPAVHMAPPDAADEELGRALASLGGLPDILLKHPEWLTALLPVVRDDLGMCASADIPAPTALPVPIHAYAGCDDPLAPAAAVAEWARYTRGDFSMRVLPGGHFFPREQEDAFLADLTRTLTALVGLETAADGVL